MGQLGMPTNGKGTVFPEIAYGRCLKNNYRNKNAVSNVIHYITRTREDESQRGDLLGYGGVGVANDLHPDYMVRQFLYVQKIGQIERRRGRRIYHEVFNFYDHEIILWNLTPEELYQFAYSCSRVYFEKGFQTVFAIHHEPGKRYHIHFAVNSISFVDEKKWHTSVSDIKQREALFNQILCKMIEGKFVRSPIYPFYGQLISESL